MQGQSQRVTAPTALSQAMESALRGDKSAGGKAPEGTSPPRYPPATARRGDLWRLRRDIHHEKRRDRPGGVTSAYDAP